MPYDIANKAECIVIAVDPEDCTSFHGEACSLARDRGVGVGRTKDLSYIAVIDDKLVGAAFTSLDGDIFSFDIAVARGFDGRGIGGKLLDAVDNLPYDLIDAKPDLEIRIDVISEVMEAMLDRRGYTVFSKNMHFCIMTRPTANY